MTIYEDYLNFVLGLNQKIIEVNQMAINGMDVAVIDCKVWIRYEHVWICNYKNNFLITRFRRRSLV